MSIERHWSASFHIRNRLYAYEKLSEKETKLNIISLYHSHLFRSHSECSGGQNDELLSTHVVFVTADSKAYSCQKCQKDFPSKHFIKQHECENDVKI